ncbi:hypothetical protein Tco_0599504 [Tanacetum coccineum]
MDPSRVNTFQGKSHLYASYCTTTEERVPLQKEPSEAQPIPSPPYPSEAPVKPQTDLSPRPSPSTTIPDSILDSSGRNHGCHSSSDKSISGMRVKNHSKVSMIMYPFLCVHRFSYQARKFKTLKVQIQEGQEQAKPEIHTTTCEEVSSLEAQIGIKRSLKKQWMQKRVYLGCSRCGGQEMYGLRRRRIAQELLKGERATQTPTSTIFGDDETIAQVLLNMIQAKAVSREKEKGEDESESKSDGIPEAEKKFKQLSSDEEMARKVQEEWEGKEERKRLAEEEATNDALIRNYDDIKARIKADRHLC